MNSTKTKFFSFGLLLGITIGFFMFTLWSQYKFASPPAQPDAIKNRDDKTTEVLVSENPLSPQFAKQAPKIFESQPLSEVKVEWVKAAEVPKVRVRVFDSEGKLIHTNSFSGTIGYVKKIPWKGGQAPFTLYRLDLVALNQLGEEGPSSESRPLKAYRKHFTTTNSNETINLSSPEIKSIQLEDADN
jgi:hypothetical protein